MHCQCQSEIHNISYNSTLKGSLGADSPMYTNSQEVQLPIRSGYRGLEILRMPQFYVAEIIQTYPPAPVGVLTQFSGGLVVSYIASVTSVGI